MYARCVTRYSCSLPQTRGSVYACTPCTPRRTGGGAFQMDELQGVLERKVRQLACRVLGRPQCPVFDRSSEEDVRVGLRCHERMFS